MQQNAAGNHISLIRKHFAKRNTENYSIISNEIGVSKQTVLKSRIYRYFICLKTNNIQMISKNCSYTATAFVNNLHFDV